MKKIYLPLLIVIFSTTWLGAQEPGESIAQPESITGRQINASGEITKEYEASYSYASNGKLNNFQFPEWGVSSSYVYENDFLNTVITHHEGDWPQYTDLFRYTYEDGRVKTEAHEWYGMNSNEYFEYEYYEDGRLYRKNYASYHPEDVYGYSIYEYENEGKTRIESYTSRTSPHVWKLKYRITCRFDDDYALLEELKDNCDENGVIISSKRKLYTYNSEGRLESEISQTLTENEWVNNSIHRYEYDNEGKVTEQQVGNWSAGLNDWNITAKSIHEYAPEDMIYRVSFYKKSGDAWVRDIFNYQTLFFEPFLKWQQYNIGCFAYEELLGSAQVNQFEFEMVYTKTPNYMSVNQKIADGFHVFPNPGNNEITIKAPLENSVIRFYDLQGRLIFAKPFDFNTTIGTSDWSQGIYIWEIWNGTQKGASGKWVKE